MGAPPKGGTRPSRTESRPARTKLCSYSPHVHLIFIILGRTDLRIDVSKATFDAESDFDVAVAPPKPGQNSEKLKFRSKFVAEKTKSPSKNETPGIVRNAFWRSLKPIGAKFEE